MIKAKKGNMLIIGLSDENLRRLKNNEPIKFNMQEVGMNDIDVFIFNGRDEQTMQIMMNGSIHPYKTIIKSDKANDN